MDRLITVEPCSIVFSYLDIMTDKSAIFLLSRDTIPLIIKRWLDQTKFIRIIHTNTYFLIVNYNLIRIETGMTDSNDIFANANWIDIEVDSIETVKKMGITCTMFIRHSYDFYLSLSEDYIYYADIKYAGMSLINKRKNTPTIRRKNGNKFWCIDTKLYYCYYNNNISWHVKCKLHRLDGPALMQHDHIGWFVNGESHRLDGPAYVTSDIESWYINGKRHRVDGPAVILSDRKEWYINGKHHRLDGPAVCSNDSQEWVIKGKLHRLDGPAIIQSDNKQWYINGKRHRLDGPAFISTCGTFQEWYVKGKRHRLDGPAKISPDCLEWYINDKLHRLDGPAVEKNKFKAWYVEGKLHRLDGPAVICEGISEEWYIDGKRHRLDGPAIIRSDKYEEFFIDENNIHLTCPYM